ncbi:MAG: hypothetical protein C3F13_16065 [Anaerolineales bacterium]|nr:hypothetical protein [Anaerolineae bacterium]PWB50465.1 MAG: hypothetical protein C3F13_16065 [Anaerolineales bacterium]
MPNTHLVRDTRQTYLSINVELYASQANGPYSRHMTTLLKCDLLIMDDFDPQPFPPPAIQDLD